VLAASEDSTAAPAAAWRAAHQVHRLAGRLHTLARVLHREQPETPVFRFAGSSRMLRSEVGLAHGRVLHASGKAGVLLYGPYVPLPAGTFEVGLHWQGTLPAGSHCALRVVCDGATRELAAVQTGPEADAGTTVLPFVLDRPCADLELQLQVPDQAAVQVMAVHIAPRRPTPMASAAPMAATGSPRAAATTT
jgi:hypothetical protein